MMMMTEFIIKTNHHQRRNNHRHASSSSSSSSFVLQLGRQEANAVLLLGESLVFQAMMQPINAQLRNLHTWGVWREKADDAKTLALPLFTVQPSDYVTRIGEHMLSLVQQLEPHMADDDPASPSSAKEEGGMHNEPLYWLDKVANKVLDTLTADIEKIDDFSDKGKRQMSADVSYLLNVMKALDVDTGEKVPKLMKMLE